MNRGKRPTFYLRNEWSFWLCSDIHCQYWIYRICNVNYIFSTGSTVFVHSLSRIYTLFCVERIYGFSERKEKDPPIAVTIFFLLSRRLRDSLKTYTVFKRLKIPLQKILKLISVQSCSFQQFCTVLRYFHHLRQRPTS